MRAALRPTMTRMPSKLPAAVVAALCLVSACSGGATHARSQGSPSATPSTSATPVVAVPAGATRDLITGTTAISHASLVAIKVDNSPLARPYQVGLGRAAIVYQEIVEGGLTRFLAIYESDVAGPGEVGPIRSGRESDVDILRAFGMIPVGFSGAQSGVKAIFHAAQRHGWLTDASYDVVPGAYRLGAWRRDARNFYAVPSALASARPGNGPVDIGFRFGDPVGGVPAPSATARFSPDTSVGLRYNATTGRYSVSQNGATTNGAAPATVIIQVVSVQGSGFRDVHGLTTPRTVSTGSGKVTVLRRGASVTGTWSRKGFGATHYKDAAGKDIVMAAGPVWVLLLPSTGSLSLG